MAEDKLVEYAEKKIKKKMYTYEIKKRID